jgi:hypothetical protein
LVLPPKDTRDGNAAWKCYSVPVWHWPLGASLLGRKAKLQQWKLSVNLSAIHWFYKSTNISF